MEVKEMALPAINKIASDYMKGNGGIRDFFHYDPQDAKSFSNRYEELRGRKFNRAELAAAIESYMGRFGIPHAAKANLVRLEREDAVVVIGGQQAGLLTGPLYTIHKVISIIKLAEEQESRLGVPVVPVFWIAGEDHDLAEVDHVYVEDNGRFVKRTYSDADSWQNKSMISDILLDQERMEDWLSGIFRALPETAYTKGLYEILLSDCRKSENMTDFFVRMILKLFGKYGVLLYDSGDKEFRKLQSPMLMRMIRENREINEAVRNQQMKIREEGYSLAIEMDANNANLFYYDKERLLLEWDEESSTFRDKGGQVSLTMAELLEKAENSPELLSNNVVTRPLMQEWIFPVLAFISGPGEIAYWAELKQVFERHSMNMPILVPRMNITIVEAKIRKDLEEAGLDLYEALVRGPENAKRRFFLSVTDEQLKWLYEKTLEQFKSNHKILSGAAVAMDESLKPLLEKNADFIANQMQFIWGKIGQSIEKRHELEIQRFTRIENALRPLGGPQERTINILHFLNEYGFDFLDQVMELPLETNPFHKVIII
ncbi:MAG: bacillithiol biosynthesis cysteine-adding enzyme BshC [Bacillus sp. (in: firmicutes)]